MYVFSGEGGWVCVAYALVQGPKLSHMGERLRLRRLRKKLYRSIWPLGHCDCTYLRRCQGS